MRKLAMVAMAIGIMMTMAGPASAAHTETKSYSSPSVGQGGVVSACRSGTLPLNTCVTFKPSPGETWVTVTITDNSGLPTYGTLGYNDNGDGLDETSVEFCVTGSIAVQDMLPGYDEVHVYIHAGPGPGNNALLGELEPCVGFGTSGTVTANFTP